MVLSLTMNHLIDQGYGKILDVKYHLFNLQIVNWLNDDLHKWTWYLNLLLIILPVIILWKVINRSRLLEVLVFGLLIAMVVTLLDSLGLAFVLWDYPDKFLPITPRLFPVDFVLLPFAYMLVYQKYMKWKDFIIANVVMSVAFAFVGEPLFVWLNLYDLIHWHYYYSFPIYIIIPIVVKWFTGILVANDLVYKNGISGKNFTRFP